MSIAAFRFDNTLRYRDGEHAANTQITPAYVLDPVREALGGEIGLDPCTEPGNPVGADVFYTIVDDGLAQPWRGPGWLPACWVNPPYGRAREPSVLRCIDAGAAGQRGILLMPAHTDTRIFHPALSTATALAFIKGRVKFRAPGPN